MPETPRRRRRDEMYVPKGSSAPPELPAVPTTPSKEPETITKTVTVTRSNKKVIKTRTITTTTTFLNNIAEEPVSQGNVPGNSEPDDFSLGSGITESDDGYISSPSPLIRYVPLPPTVSPPMAEVNTPPTTPAAARSPPLVTRTRPVVPCTSPITVRQPSNSLRQHTPVVDPSPLNTAVTHQSLPMHSQAPVLAGGAASHTAPLVPATPILPVAPNAIRVYIAPRPEDLEPIPGDITLWVLSSGGGGGIYKTKKEADEVCKKAGWRIYTVRKGWPKAIAAYKVAWEAGTILIEPNDTGPFSNAPYIDIIVKNPNPDLRTAIPRPETLVPPIKDAKYYYVVLIGEEVGIFGSWHEAGIRTQKLGGFVRKFETWLYAHAEYKRAFDNQEIKVKPRPGGFFDPSISAELRAAVRGEI